MPERVIAVALSFYVYILPHTRNNVNTFVYVFIDIVYVFIDNF